MKALEFTAGGQVHALRFDVNALCRIEELTGMGVADAAKLLSPETGVARMTDMRVFFQAGLVERMDAEQAGSLMAEVGFEAALELVVRAFDLAFGKGRGGGADATRPASGKKLVTAA
jgi:hypothetical protein